MKRCLLAITLIAFAAGGLSLRIGGRVTTQADSTTKVAAMDLTQFSTDPPDKTLQLLFIHHSCGGQWLADPGRTEDGSGNCIYRLHPNGGGLRALLETNGYRVHEASYGSEIGHRTDIFDWPAKFRYMMEPILTCSGQNTCFTDETRNQIVLFKSCFPQNKFTSLGTPPGLPHGGELTVWNARAAYRSLLDDFARHPAVLFVCVTAPPLAPRVRSEPIAKLIARSVLNKPDGLKTRLVESGDLARQFNNWLKSSDGWLKDYPHPNVVVFDYYDLLTACGQSNLSGYPTRNGSDSHPSSDGNREATHQLLPFLNRAARRAGLS